MPKKKKGGGGKSKGGGGKSSRAEAKAKNKKIEDLTFGMKNKKGKKQQKYIEHVKNQVHNKGKQSRGGVQAEKSKMFEAKKAKKRKEKEAAQMAKLLGIAKIEAQVLTGVKKKKKKKKKTEGEKLKASGNTEAGAVADRQAARRRLRKQRKKQKLADIDLEELMYEEETPIEELIEEERRELIESGKELTPVTLENFLEWKKNKKAKKDAKALKNKEISGRLLFETNAEKYNVDDDSAAVATEYDEVVSAEDAAQKTATMESENEVAPPNPPVTEANDESIFLDEGLDALDGVEFD